MFSLHSEIKSHFALYAFNVCLFDDSVTFTNSNIFSFILLLLTSINDSDECMCLIFENLMSV